MRKMAILLFLAWGAAACSLGPTVTIGDGLARPPREGGTRPAAGNERVAVRDFTEAFPVSREVGRDFDHARAIVWDGVPGKALADLVAAALGEKGIGAVRIAADAEPPPGIGVVVGGRVETFRVDAKRSQTLRVDMTARAALSLEVAGVEGAPGWKGTVSSEYQVSDLFVTPAEIRNALNGAANAVADEAAKRLAAEAMPGAAETPR